ncbi:MAG: type II toxin-antitoxin system VapC family toxin [Chloroflexota bacterium]|nr:type II toxin-antitoxin system VapC family toxin [Chloroflexota bacterium]MBI5704611.1 type II toxin-antitoxin system VapC family toxin [Chloroflexota bacterium]
MPEKPAFVLDTFALMAHFGAETGGEKVRDLLIQAEDGKILLAMSLINMGELAYIIGREQGKEKALEALDDLRSFPITFYEATEERILAAAWLKAKYPISYADAFSASLAQELGASLVTGDPEFKAIKKNLSLFWLGR